MIKEQTTNRRWLAGLACVCAAALALWACKEDNPTPDPPTVSLAMSGATGTTDNVSVSRADGTGELQWPQGKTLGRTFTVSLSAAAPSEVTVGLSIVRSENIPAGSVALSPETVRIAAGQTSGTATLTVADEAFLRAGGTFELGVRTGTVQGAQAPAQPLEAKVVATVKSFSPNLSMTVEGVTTGGADNFTATRADDCAVTFPDGKSLTRTVTLSLSAPATTDAVVSLALTPSNLTEDQAKLSTTTVTISAGQTSGTATVTGPTTTDLAEDETTAKTYGWTVAVSAVEGITAPATLPQATVAVTVPACEKKEEPEKPAETCDKTTVTITYTDKVAEVSETTRTETQCVEVTYDENQQTYTFKKLKIDNITKDWTVGWETYGDYGGYLFGDCGDYDYADKDKCWLYAISGGEKPTTDGEKVTKFKATIAKLQTDDPDDIDAMEKKIGEISIGE